MTATLALMLTKFGPKSGRVWPDVDHNLLLNLSKHGTTLGRTRPDFAGLVTWAKFGPSRQNAGKTEDELSE